eukprot:g4128.t1
MDAPTSGVFQAVYVLEVSVDYLETYAGSDMGQGLNSARLAFQFLDYAPVVLQAGGDGTAGGVSCAHTDSGGMLYRGWAGKSCMLRAAPTEMSAALAREPLAFMLFKQGGGDANVRPRRQLLGYVCLDLPDFASGVTAADGATDTAAPAVVMCGRRHAVVRFMGQDGSAVAQAAVLVSLSRLGDALLPHLQQPPHLQQARSVGDPGVVDATAAGSDCDAAGDTRAAGAVPAEAAPEAAPSP